MKDLKRKIHYWCSDTMQNKITGKGVVCAVLDTGITQHPDLVGRIVGWKDCVQGKKTIYDDNGHGTHVAGILAGNGKSGRGLYLSLIHISALSASMPATRSIRPILPVCVT